MMGTDVQLLAVVDDVADAREYRYDVPFKFTGKINRVTFNLGEEQLTARRSRRYCTKCPRRRRATKV